jgi:GxxExxY protein
MTRKSTKHRKNKNKNMVKIIYKNLSYKIMGLIFNVFKNIGYGYREKYYQRALEEEFKKENIKYKRESPALLIYEGKIIGKYFMDFIIEDRVILELKVAKDFYTKDIKQILSYLTAKNLKLGILAIITKDGVKYKRLVN